jgi:WD40 repeat protein
VTCLQFDDSRIISGALDRLIKIWDIITGQVCNVSCRYTLSLSDDGIISASSLWIGLNQKDTLE